MLKKDHESDNEIKKIGAEVIERALNEIKIVTHYRLWIGLRKFSTIEMSCIQSLNFYMDKSCTVVAQN